MSNFKICTQDAYDKSDKDTNSFYITEIGTKNENVYLGNIKLSSQVDIDNLFKKLEDLEERVGEIENKKSLDEYSWSEIQSIVQAGDAENYWSVGDTTDLISLNGTINSACVFNDYRCRAFLIGFDHNMDLETESKHNITLQFAQEQEGINIAFIDGYYGSYSTASGRLSINSSNSNQGGWESSQIRNRICPIFLEMLPNDLQNVIGLTTKYTDNRGNAGGNTESNITPTQDKIFLLSCYEVNSSGGNINTYEGNYTTFYNDIFDNDSGKIKYRHSELASASSWWLRSVHRNNGSECVAISESGTITYHGAYYSYGFAPAFTIY